MIRGIENNRSDNYEEVSNVNELVKILTAEITSLNDPH